MELTMSAWNGTFEEWEDTRPATDAEVLAYVATLDGAEIVGERTIEWRDEYGGFAKDVLDYDIGKRRNRSFLVIPLPDKETTDDPEEEE